MEKTSSEKTKQKKQQNNSNRLSTVYLSLFTQINSLWEVFKDNWHTKTEQVE